MKRVLVVSPSFPPINAADGHRVRTSLPFYREFGWHPFVLAVDPDAHGGLLEPSLAATVPEDVEVTRTSAWPVSLTRMVGVRNVALRAWSRLLAAGGRIIAERDIDLVYFSTTMFAAVPLGRIWKARFGTPYVIDVQDPWKSDYRGRGAPGGIKAALARAMHGVLEPFAMRRVDGIVSVSPAYAETLRLRYPWIHRDMCATIPFGASRADVDAARQMAWRNPIFDREDGRVHGVAVGRGGRDMETAAGVLFRACRLWLDQDGQEVRPQLWFIGTSYASDLRQRSIAPVAESAGLGAFVGESPARVPYLESLRLVAEAHFTIILGSDDASYSPSKVHPYLVSGRPFIAVLHESCPAVPLLRQSGAGIVVTFRDPADVPGAASELAAQMTTLIALTRQPAAVSDSILESISARALTARQCLAFDAALGHASPGAVPCVE